MRPDILVLGALTSPHMLQQLEAGFTCHHAWRLPAAEQEAFIASVAGKARAVVTNGGLGISRELIAQLPAIEIIAVNGIGVDAVPFDATRARGIAVTNTPGVLTDDVADLGVLLLMAAARRLPWLDSYVRRGDWDAKKPIAPALSLRGKVAGIFGFGRIGQAISHRLAAFGMRLCYYQPNPVAGTDVERVGSLHELAERCDYLVVAAPGGERTRHSIDGSILDALGPTGTLVNIARGSVVDEAALIAALTEGRLGAAALDVFEDEPHVPEALRALPNVVLTPHVASLTVETRQAMGQLVVDNLLAHFAGKPLPTPVA
ncbi:2-hydroxyacid dehydrogenase [Noviherbaspirillum pedocola]|uniref:2-hydroxyacid dehydrogenase n=1 Tax=Noviherbaspirillum pedocola TaxID=2801341 RepID=A0A934SQZ6_9BURK|nr:2-hydroxyacid dehydrogenase [Noviherbaspirillum pedocola]MBK4735136.1 2-hydroxyacid dehydrogenase [Noviherbaspirillum pedocola]